MQTASEIRTLIKNNDYQNSFDELLRLHDLICQCASHSMYSFNNGNDISYYGSFTCDHKMCFICNWNRQKRLRRKYLLFFKENQKLFSLKKAKSEKIVTSSQKERLIAKGYKLSNKHEYDLMHLVLTVPHSDGMFASSKSYFDILKKKFWDLRRSVIWKEMIFGGEYGIEVTKKENGLHIHIHSLLFVKKVHQSRNLLRREILIVWNRLTADGATVEFTEDQKTGLKKGNPLLTDSDINRLNTTGATLISLDIIYSIENSVRVRSSEFGSEIMLKAVLETISYHFEPHCFDKLNKTIDIQLIAEVLPHIYRQKMYEKFGCLYKEKLLNLNEKDSTLDDMIESAELAKDEKKYFKEYFISDPLFMYHKNDDSIKISEKGKFKIRMIDAASTSFAMHQMLQYAVNMIIRNKNKRINND